MCYKSHFLKLIFLSDQEIHPYIHCLCDTHFLQQKCFQDINMFPPTVSKILTVYNHVFYGTFCHVFVCDSAEHVHINYAFFTKRKKTISVSIFYRV